MDRGRLFLAVVLLFSLGSSVGHARKCLIFGHGGIPLRGLFTVKIESQMEPQQVVNTEHQQLPALVRYFHEERRPATMFRMQHPRLQRLLVREDLDFLASNRMSKSFICDTCLDISTFAEQVLTDPETTNNVLEYINGSVCEAMSGLKEECCGMAATYVPEMVEMLQLYLAPDKLCGDTNLCPSSSMILHETCTTCTDFATKALTYLKDNKTETEVLEGLHAECSNLGKLSARCDLLVDAYAPVYIEEFDSVTPDQVCKKVGLCSATSLEGTSHCAACELAVFEMKAKLRNPEVQEKMLEVLLDGCSKVPNHIDQCKEIITQYGPFILANIDTFVDADTLCTKIHACETSSALSVTPVVEEKKIADTTESLIQLPTALHGTASQ